MRRNIFAVLMCAFVLCIAYGCSPTYPECYDDTHCEAKGEYCVNAKCAECRNDEHCTSKKDESYYCNNGTCQRINGYCNPDAGINCPAGQKCRDRRCGPQCYPETVEEDCQPNELCEHNRCVPKPECVTDEDCPAGKICRNQHCVDAPVCQMSLAYFDFDESAIRSDAKSVINDNAKCLKERSISSVQVIGHCDERGDDDYNMGLGKRRADSVRSVLENAGIKASTKSRGAQEPVVPNARSESDHQRNRRAEFVIQ